jgi:CubicO group peptidase (beta-lactamase class C family)
MIHLEDLATIRRLECRVAGFNPARGFGRTATPASPNSALPGQNRGETYQRNSSVQRSSYERPEESMSEGKCMNAIELQSSADRHTRAVTRLVVCVCFAVAMGQAQTGVPASLRVDVERITNEAMRAQQIPAVTVAIATGQGIVYSGAFGMADLENAVPATTDTMIRTGSLAKPISAAAAMTLADSGRLDLDAPVQKYCPPFPLKQWPVSTRELLSHTSGIRHYKEGEVENTRRYRWMSDGFSIFANDPLLFEPGTGYSYSTYGYTVLGCVIEGASHQGFGEYVAGHVLKPAAMMHTFIDDALEIVPHRARGYQKMSGKVKNAGLMDSSYKIPGGGYVTSAEDLIRFAEALIDGKIVKPNTLSEMWTPTRIKDSGGKASSYGLGFGILALDGGLYVAHTGDQQGTSAILVIIPGRHFAAAALANMDDVDLSNIMHGILEEFDMPYPNRPKK